MSTVPVVCSLCFGMGLERSKFETKPRMTEEEDEDRILGRQGTIAQLRNTKEACKLCSLVWDTLQLNEATKWSSYDSGTSWKIYWGDANPDYEATPEEDEQGLEALERWALHPVIDVPNARSD